MVKAKPKEYEDVTCPVRLELAVAAQAGQQERLLWRDPEQGQVAGQGLRPAQEGEGVAAGSLRQAAGCGHTGGKVRGMVQAGHENDPQPQEVRAS